MAINEENALEWANSVLASRADSLAAATDYADFADGLLIIQLAEAAFPDQPLPAYNRAPKMLFHKLNNISIAIEFFKKQGVLLTNIDSQSIGQGNVKVIVGLLFALHRTLNPPPKVSLAIQGPDADTGSDGAAAANSKDNIVSAAANSASSSNPNFFAFRRSATKANNAFAFIPVAPSAVSASLTPFAKSNSWTVKAPPPIKPTVGNAAAIGATKSSDGAAPVAATAADNVAVAADAADVGVTVDATATDAASLTSSKSVEVDAADSFVSSSSSEVSEPQPESSLTPADAAPAADVAEPASPSPSSSELSAVPAPAADSDVAAAAADADTEAVASSSASSSADEPVLTETAAGAAPVDAVAVEAVVSEPAAPVPSEPVLAEAEAAPAAEAEAEAEPASADS